MSRMPPLDVEALSPEQKRVYDQIAGKRKTVRGPFPMWLRNPKLAEHANQFGVALRDHSTIGRRIFELASSRCAGPDRCSAPGRRMRRRPNCKASRPKSSRPSARTGRRISRKADERVAYEVAKEIMDTNELSQAGYDKAIQQFGEQGTVELISTIGYYAMVGIFLKSFDVRPPDGSTPLK